MSNYTPPVLSTRSSTTVKASDQRTPRKPPPPQLGTASENRTHERDEASRFRSTMA